MKTHVKRIGHALFALVLNLSMIAMNHRKKVIRWKIINGSKRTNEKKIAAGKNYWQWVQNHKYEPKRLSATNYLEHELEKQIKNNQIEPIQWLIELGANLNPRNYRLFGSWPPLTTAARIGNVRICKLLIDAGADINQEPKHYGPHRSDYNALWHAVYYGHIDVIKLLIHHGLSRPRSNLILLPLLPSIEMHKNFKEIQELFEPYGIALEMRMPAEQHDLDRDLLERSAKGERDIFEIKRLLQLGARVNYAHWGNSTTPLHVAASQGLWGVKTTKLFLKRGANPNAQNSSLQTPLMHASGTYGRAPNQEICKMLLDAQADPVIKNAEGATAMLIATQEGHYEICQLLLDHQRKQEALIVILLALLKRHEHASGRMLYHLRKDILRPYLAQFTVKALLRAKNNKGECISDPDKVI